MTVLVVGDVGADLLVRLPARSGAASLRSIRPDLHPGGTVGNTSLALRQLGLGVTLVSAVGDDIFGRFLADAFAQAGIETRFSTVVGRPSMLILGIVDQEGERHLAMYPTEGMASGYLPPEAVQPAWVEQASWVHASGSSFREGTTAEAAIRAMATARRRGVAVSFDLNVRTLDGSLSPHVRQLLTRAVEQSDYVLGSALDEFTLLTGHTDALMAARQLSVGRVAVGRLGSSGCAVFVDGAGPSLVDSFPVAVVDTLGAGDAFDAGFIAGMLEGCSVDEAARWGNATAALSLAGFGATENVSRASLLGLVARDPGSTAAGTGGWVA